MVVKRGLERGELDAYAVQSAVLRHEIEIITVSAESLLDTPGEPRLHVGEQHAIALARQQTADWLLLDNLLARTIAQQFGVRVKGSLGLVIEAHRQNVLNTAEVELIFQTLLSRGDIWISDALIRRVQEEWRLTLD